MARRNDIRIALDPALGQVIASAADVRAWERLEKAKVELAGAVQDVEDAMAELPEHVVSTFVEAAASSASRHRGEASIEIDPDGALVLVFSYGGRSTPALARDVAPARAWGSSLPSLAEAKAAARVAGVNVSDCGRSTRAIMDRVAAQGRNGTRPRSGGGFIKTAPAISAQQQQVDDLDHLFDDEPTAPKPTAPKPTAPKPTAPKPTAGRLTALATASAKVDLGSILDSD
jgi:cell division septation protein DedD